MATQGTRGADGPGNKVIATTLLEALAVRGRSVAAERGLRALADTGTDLAAASTWLSEGAIDSLFAAAEVESGLARAIGHRLVAPDATGLKLYGLGLATPEKAYRRVQSLLPREAAAGRWHVEGIEGRSATLTYRVEGGAGRTAEALCAMRRGMLEAIPGLYGLLPAGVDVEASIARGDETCRYVVRWQASRRTGALAGLVAGLGIAAGTVCAGLFFGGFPLSPGAGLAVLGVIAGGAVLTGVALGSAIDLRRQLEAVAGARRGHLALFDQVDDALAAKLDALARADAKLDAEPAPSPVRSSGSMDASRSEDAERALRHAAHEIHAAAGDLECFFEVYDADRGRANEISDERGRVRDIREWAARIAEKSEVAEWKTTVDVARLVERAVATARPGLAGRARIRVDAAPDLAPLRCEPVQLEYVVAQLVKNAVEASVELSDEPDVVIGLRETSGGLELSVEDRGIGIESTEVDEVFDPFFGERPAGAGGLGLTVCLRIVERHGGALQIENQARAGTRVTVVLPREGPDGSEEEST
ncbi:MAG: HAMP domain-containing histidine kinase [bacterium]|nr:HAMP domain-containing histidine kinase [bacterium]